MNLPIKYDSLACMQRLRATGLPERQAEAIAEMFTEVRLLPTLAKQPPREFDTHAQFKKLCATGFTEELAEAFLGELIIAFWGIVPGFYQEDFQRFCDGR